ncbi:MAG: NADH-quinone oxidoreductase subunit NuoH [Chloroflexi bacterium]|nr:NADH-quinone oxidoreductase subunit NuoH [Chloroflexota bacterium]
MDLDLLIDLGIVGVKIAIAVWVLLTAVAYLIFLERRLVGRMQARIGPNRVGPFGLLQPLADILKLIFKEEIIPQGVDLPVYFLAPAVAVIPALMSFAVIPIGPSIQILGRQTPLYIADLNIGLLYVLAMSSMAVYGVVLAGWSSGSKYSFLGALRSSAQMISYELPVSLAVMGVLLVSGSLSLVEIVESQKDVWNVMLQPLGFVLYLIAAVAEVNRAPFDLPEAETELVAGYHTEYSSLKWGLFFLSEYINMIVVSSLAVTLFLGGWNGPLLPPLVWYFIKLFALIFLFVWLRATFPRLRYDRLMQLGWKRLMPLALVNILLTATAIVVRDMLL